MFVAHRLRTIYDSDQILVLEDGQVVEMGSHRELLDLEGVYAELWNGKLADLARPEDIANTKQSKNHRWRKKKGNRRHSTTSCTHRTAVYTCTKHR